MKIFPIRLKPEQDLKASLKTFVEQNNIQSGFILTTVGSLKQATLRFASQDETQVFEERFEIVSLVGTLSTHGLHLHISLSDKNGETIGGHLVDGCIIYTTAEIIVGTTEDFTFLRTVDTVTGYKELEIQPK
ncbi:DNA-binding protein [Microcoleus sp. FACHB-SPT15]|jgi:predicted DNA-binding protein with PD1-like motif|uniref:PPC domain-containing DNA-binding protein n=1 Tax=Microcoleus sp. FACHB-SPT15 TaxID=2692830 RepID=UPI001783620A|nr:PPC domain-containing DNA-binding protein [Microcoleus sp. FACHB-SPT15]MBD1805403.1 DNA-binding protein [Microcoleus sp. FACHB-SPT15]